MTSWAAELWDKRYRDNKLLRAALACDDAWDALREAVESKQSIDETWNAYNKACSDFQEMLDKVLPPVIHI